MCILRLGKTNNVVSWNEELKSTVGAIYGSTANFLQTNARYIQHPVVEADYLSELEEGAPALPAGVITKLREGAYEGRRRAIAQQKSDEQKIWSIMWGRMSPASQSKIEESEAYRAALFLSGGFIRRTHLTHIYGDGDPMVQVNINEQERGFNGAESHSAFVFGNTKTPAVEKAPTTTKPSDDKKKATLKMKRESKVICYVCGASGHYARTCPLRKEGPDSEMVTDYINDHNSDDSEDYNDEAAYVANEKTVLFSSNGVLLDSQASVSVFCNGNLLSEIGESSDLITLNGVQFGAPRIKISQEGQFRELGKVYFSPKTFANILSYAVMVDNGNNISYSQTTDSFTLSPKGAARTLSSAERQVAGLMGGSIVATSRTDRRQRFFRQ